MYDENEDFGSQLSQVESWLDDALDPTQSSDDEEEEEEEEDER